MAASNDGLARLARRLRTVQCLLAVLVRLVSLDRFGISRRLGRKDAKRRRYTDVTVGHRDRLAASSMLSVATGQDGVLIWGTGHLPGISALLAEQGFRHVKTEWLRSDGCRAPLRRCGSSCSQDDAVP